MAKTTNFLSIALLVSVLAVRPMFATGADATAAPHHETVAHKIEEKVHHVEAEIKAAVHHDKPAGEAAPTAAGAHQAPAEATRTTETAKATETTGTPSVTKTEVKTPETTTTTTTTEPGVGTTTTTTAPALKGAKLFAAIDHLNPFEYGKTAQANNPTISAAAKYLTVIGLVASNSGVHSVIGSIVSAVQNACGVADADQSEDDSTKEPRLTIGRRS